MGRKKYPVTVRQITPQGARARLTKQARERESRRQQSGTWKIGQHDASEVAKQVKAPPPRVRRRNGPKATDYVPEAYSPSQKTSGRVTPKMHMGTKIRRVRTKPYTDAVSAGADIPVRQRVVTRRRDGSVPGPPVYRSETGK